MDRIRHQDTSIQPPNPNDIPPSGSPDDRPGFFIDCDLDEGQLGTPILAYWANMITEEIRHAIAYGGIAPQYTDWTQLARAIEAIAQRRIDATDFGPETFLELTDTPDSYNDAANTFGGAGVLSVNNDATGCFVRGSVRAYNGNLHVGVSTQINGPGDLTGFQSANGPFSVWNNIAGQRLFRVDPAGNTYNLSGNYTAGADYAEYFPVAEGADGPVDLTPGTSVVLDAGRVRAATPDDAPDQVIGVVRPKTGGPGVIGNAAEDGWAGRWARDAFGAPEYENRLFWHWPSKTGDDRYHPRTGTDADRPPPGWPEDCATIEVPVQRSAAAFDPNRAYVPRSQRRDWAVIGLLGQIPVLTGQPVNPRWVPMSIQSDGVQLYLVR